MRYLKQRKSAVCGPVAVLNAFKKLGYPLTEVDLNWLIKDLNCDPVYGTLKRDVIKLLKEGFKVKSYKNTKLQNNQLLLVLYYLPKCREMHYMLVDSNYQCYNYYNDNLNTYHTTYIPGNIKKIIKESYCTLLEMY